MFDFLIPNTMRMFSRSTPVARQLYRTIGTYDAGTVVTLCDDAVIMAYDHRVVLALERKDVNAYLLVEEFQEIHETSVRWAVFYTKWKLGGSKDDLETVQNGIQQYLQSLVQPSIRLDLFKGKDFESAES